MSRPGAAEPHSEVANPAASASVDASAATMEEDTAADPGATHEDRRVMAFASELRISSAISPRELLSLRLTSPLESNDELDSEEEGGKEEDATSSRGGNASGSEGPLGRCVCILSLALPTLHVCLRCFSKQIRTEVKKKKNWREGSCGL